MFSTINITGLDPLDANSKMPVLITKMSGGQSLSCLRITDLESINKVYGGPHVYKAVYSHVYGEA